MTAFQCRCNRENICLKSFGSCNLCQTCSCLIFCNDIPHVTICPVCRVNESWEIIGFSCLACWFAAMVYRNHFHRRFQKQLEQWLVSCEDTDISRDTMSMPLRMQRQYTIQSNSDMLRQRNQTFEKTYQEMKSRATPEQTHFVFENLTLLQLSIQNLSLKQIWRRPRKKRCTSLGAAAL